MGAPAKAARPPRPRSRLPLIGLVLSAAGFVLAPGMVSVGLYMPIFDSMNQLSGTRADPSAADSFGHFGAWALFPVLLTLPGLVVSLVALVRAWRGESDRGLAIAGAVTGGLAFLAVSAFTLYLYGGVL
jgi:hypothetical protein